MKARIYVIVYDQLRFVGCLASLHQVFSGLSVWNTVKLAPVSLLLDLH